MGKGLTEEQIQFYKDNGYVVIKNLLSPQELQEISDEYDNLFQRCNQGIIENSWVGELADGLRLSDSLYSVKGVHNLQNHHVVFSKFISNEKLIDVIEDVMGTPNIMLHHTKAHFKPPEKGAMYPMHQDYHYFPYKLDSPVAVFLNLDRTDPENGGLHMYPGTHKLGPLEDWGAKEGEFHWVDKVKGVHNLQNHHAVFSKFISNEKLIDVIEDIMETPNIMLHHTKAHFKPPEKGAMYPMHQDYHYFPYELDSLVAAFLHLDRSDPENGGLHVYPGSHKLGPLEDWGAKEGEFHWVDKKEYPIEKSTPVIAEKGDIVIFSYLLVHGSTLNTSKDRNRRMFLVQYLNADDRQLPKADMRVKPGYGWMFRGMNKNKDESVAKTYSAL